MCVCVCVCVCMHTREKISEKWINRNTNKIQK